MLSYKKHAVFNGFSMGCNVIEGRCRGVVRLSFQPKAAYLEGRCRGVVRLNLLPKAAYLEVSCRGVVLFRVATKED